MSYLMQYEPGQEGRSTPPEHSSRTQMMLGRSLERVNRKCRELERQLAAVRKTLALFDKDEIAARKQLRREQGRTWIRQPEDDLCPDGFARSYFLNAYGESALHAIKCPVGWSLPRVIRFFRHDWPEIYCRLRSEPCDGGRDCTGRWFTPFNAKFHKRTGKNARWIITFQRWRDV